jgi:transcriptional regulator with XRE-family HTH domain
VDDTADNSPPPGPASLPERAVTPNMLAAFNMTRWRKAAGLTQEELGELLGGWTKNAVSAAESSWNGKRVRQFDADLICNLASIFCVPVSAFLLPPPDDGETVRYVIGGEDGPVPMERLFALLWPDPQGQPVTAAMGAYQQAVISAMAKYAGGEAAEILAENMADKAEEEEIEGALRSARANREALTSMHSLIDRLADENEMLQDALERALAGKRAGQ